MTMNIEYLLQLLINRLTLLKDAKIQAEAQGDVDRVFQLDSEIASFEATISQMGTL